MRGLQKTIINGTHIMKTKQSSNPVGRPLTITPEIIVKLREAYLIGATDKEACAYANIGQSTLYEYQKNNPEFTEQKEAWKDEPILQAKKTVVESLKETKDAQWYLERKKKDEFSTRTEQTGREGKDLIPTFTVATKDSKELLEKLYEGSDSSND